MKKWPWWVWAAIGLVCGAGATAALLEWTRIDHAEIWRAATAMQGWVGAVVGAVVGAAGAFGAAFFVLQRTLADERARFEQQRAAEDRRFSEQRALEDARFAAQRIEDDRRLRRQLRESKMQADRVERAQRRSETEQKRIEVWASIVATAREFFWFPVDETELQSLQIRLTSLLFEWEMYTSEADRETVRGVRAVASEILGTAARQASAQRDSNAHLAPRDRVTHLRCTADDAIVDLGKYGVLMHRKDIEAQQRGVEWFRSRPV